MYEKPRLVPVGEVEQVVLGTTGGGADLDVTSLIYTFEYEDETAEL